MQRKSEEMAGGANKKRKHLTWRKKSEILAGLEVSYVPSSSTSGAASYDAAPPRTTPRSSIPTF
jgi:hypothetical protein